MRKYLPLVLKTVVICLALLVGSYLFAQPGYIKIAYGDSYVETTILSLFSAILCLWILEKIVIKFWGLFGYRRKRAENLLNMGLSAYLMQDWQRAEKLLSKDGPKGQLPPARKLFAALAANKIGDKDKVAEHLANLKSKDIQTQLLKVELLLDNDQVDEAYDQISPLFVKKPRDNGVLSLFVRTLEAKSQWGELLEVLPRVAKQQLYTDELFEQFAAKTIKSALEQTAKAQTFVEVEHQWKKIPNKFKKPVYAQVCYIEILVGYQKHQEAESLLLKLVKKGDIVDFLPLLRKTRFNDTVGLSQYIQKALKSDPNNIPMLSALAYLALSKEDYQLAAKALEKAYEQHTNLLAHNGQELQQQQSPQQLTEADLRVLAQAYARTGQHTKAVVVYQHLLQS